MLKKLWDKVNGYKTIAGAVITVLAYLAAGVPLLTPFIGAVAVAKIAGIFTLVLGLLHRAYKLVYKTDHE